MARGTALASAQGLRLFWAIGGDFNCGITEADEGIKRCPRAAGNYSMAVSPTHQRRDFIVMQGKGAKQIVPDEPLYAWDKMHVAVFCHGGPWRAPALAATQGEFLKEAEALQDQISSIATRPKDEEEDSDSEEEQPGELRVLTANTGLASSSSSLAPTQGEGPPPPPREPFPASTITPPPPPPPQKREAPEEPPEEPPQKRLSPPRQDDDFEPDYGGGPEAEKEHEEAPARKGNEEATDASCANAEATDASCANAEEWQLEPLPQIRYVEKPPTTCIGTTRSLMQSTSKQY